ncbi:MAG: hypothetical protein AAB464_00155 [Patescibacteria group bacterium]
MKILALKVLKIYLWLKVWLLLFVLFGCAPGDQLIFRPDIHISGDFNRRYSSFYDYGTFYPYKIIVLINGTPNEFEIFVNGRRADITLENNAKANRIPPGLPARISVYVDYKISRQVSVVAVAYKNNRVVGVANRVFYFYGNANQQEVVDWAISRWDIRDP